MDPVCYWCAKKYPKPMLINNFVPSCTRLLLQTTPNLTFPQENCSDKMSNTFPLDKETNQVVTIRLFREVKNVPDLRKELIGGTLKCCFVKPTLILDPFQIVVAANKAVVSEKLKTKTVYTEILFNLSLSSKITQSLLKFGIHDDDKNLLMVVVHNPNEEVSLFGEVEGEEVELSNLPDLNDLEDIKRTYKVGDFDVKNSSLLDFVVSKIAVKEFL